MPRTILSWFISAIILRWMVQNKEQRKMCYLSAEYLIGPQLGNNLVCFGGLEIVKQAVTELGIDFDKLLDCEEEPRLGNGGLWPFSCLLY